VNPPLDVLRGVRLWICFSGIGLFYLLPLDVLFSIWFFYLFAQLQMVVANSYNMDMPTLPLYYVPQFTGYQAIGAYIVLAGFLFYTARRHLATVFRSASRCRRWTIQTSFSLSRGGFRPGIVLPRIGRVAAVGGNVVWLAIFELGAYVFLIALVMARSTVESGLIMTETSFRAVDIYRVFAPPARWDRPT